MLNSQWVSCTGDHKCFTRMSKTASCACGFIRLLMFMPPCWCISRIPSDGFIWNMPEPPHISRCPPPWFDICMFAEFAAARPGIGLAINMPGFPRKPCWLPNLPTPLFPYISDRFITHLKCQTKFALNTHTKTNVCRKTHGYRLP